jgi:hypothetical protein
MGESDYLATISFNIIGVLMLWAARTKGFMSQRRKCRVLDRGGRDSLREKVTDVLV